MRTLRWLTVALLVALAVAPPAFARVVSIETTAPLADHSDQSIDRAIKGAVATSVQGAIAMGLAWIWLHETRVLQDAIIVRMIATDEDLEDDEEDLGMDARLRAELF